MKKHCALCGSFFPTLDEYATTCPGCRPKELALYGDEIGAVCGGCGKLSHPDDILMCEECGKVVCKTCPGTCPHREPQPGEQADFLGFWRGDYGTHTDIITTDKE